MDDDRFDSLARLIGSAASRRRVARAMLAVAVAGVAGFPGFLRPRDAAAACRQVGRTCERGDRCCGGARCRAKRCRCPRGEVECGRRCINPLTDGANCGRCGASCASGQCLHGTCTCDPFNNQCPSEVDGQCSCGGVAGSVFQAACVDRNSACDLSKPCQSNADCPPRSVCLGGCSDPPDPQPNRCSNPCVPV